MDVVLSKRQGCQGVGSRAAAHSKTIAYGLAGIGVLFFLFVLSYTTWTLSLRTNMQQATNQTADELLTGGNATDLYTVSNVTNEEDIVDTSPQTSIAVQTTHPFDENVRLTPPRGRAGRKRGGRKKIRKNYRKQIHQLLSKLLGNGRVGDDENDSTKVRNETDNNDNNNNKRPKKKNNTGRPKYRVVVPGRRRKKKKNRNSHRKTSSQRPGVAVEPTGVEKRRDRLKGDSSGQRNDRTKAVGCDRKSECRRDKTHNGTDVKRDNASTSTPPTRNRQTGNSVKREESDKSNITVETSIIDTVTVKHDRLGKKSNETPDRVVEGRDLKQTDTQRVRPTPRPSKHRCPDESDRGNKPAEDSTIAGLHGHNSNKSRPCPVATCNSSDASVERNRKHKCAGPEARLSGGDADAIVGEGVDGGGGVDEENDAEADDKDDGYGAEEEGWKSNMERIFAEFEQERADDQLDTLRQVKWNQSKGKFSKKQTSTALI